MGKKKQSGGGGCNGTGGVVVEKAAAREFTLKVAMHCRCDGCTNKLRAAVRDITLAQGVVAADQSKAEATGEVRVLATADPERLRKTLRKATGKKVDLVFPPAKERKKNDEQEAARVVDAAAVQALLADLQLHQYGGQAPVNQYQQAAWAANQQQLLAGLGGAGGYGQAAYPWTPNSSPASYYPVAPAPAAAWGGYGGGYGYAPAAPASTHGQGHGGGYYGASVPAWHGQGY